MNYLQLLFLNQDKKYQEFQERLIYTKYEIIGVRTPVIKQICQDLVKLGDKTVLNTFMFQYYEEVLLYGLLIGRFNEKEEFIQAYKKYLRCADNWAHIDQTIASYKFVLKDLDYYFSFFVSLANQEEEFVCRAGIVALFTYYSSDKYIDKVLKTLVSIVSEKYYVNMALAWAFSSILTKDSYYDLVIVILKENKLSPFVHNKTISKSCDSFQVSVDKKEYLKTLRIK